MNIRYIYPSLQYGNNQHWKDLLSGCERKSMRSQKKSFVKKVETKTYIHCSSCGVLINQTGGRKYCKPCSGDRVTKSAYPHYENKTPTK